MVSIGDFVVLAVKTIDGLKFGFVKSFSSLKGIALVKMTTYRPIDSKREEFRKYLERAGVMDALTKVLVALYEEPEKPVDAMDFVRKNLGDDRPERCELVAALNELAEAQTKIAMLEEALSEVKTRLEKYEPPENGSQNAE